MIDLKAIKEKANNSIEWAKENNTFALMPMRCEDVLSLLRIIEVQKNSLEWYAETEYGNKDNREARAALEQVSKILTEQNEGEK